jgi:hypothetical protein
MSLTLGNLLLGVAAVLAFLLAIEWLPLEKSDIRIDWVTLFFFITGVLFKGVVLIDRIRVRNG